MTSLYNVVEHIQTSLRTLSPIWVLQMFVCVCVGWGPSCHATSQCCNQVLSRGTIMTVCAQCYLLCNSSNNITLILNVLIIWRFALRGRYRRTPSSAVYKEAREHRGILFLGQCLNRSVDMFVHQLIQISLVSPQMMLYFIAPTSEVIFYCSNK